MEQQKDEIQYSLGDGVHFTYKNDMDKSSLCQGDLLRVTDELREILKDVHPFFLNEQYKYFMVLTQSCDLVRRNASSCKTPYITLAAVRSFDTFFDQCLVSNHYAENVNGFLLMDDKQKERAYQLLERLYNNTEPDYFFLFRDESLSFPESMIASLKVSIALKSNLHYEQCLAAKALELSDEFKAKLGWLVGNIYSRVGTTDWDSIMTASQRKDMLNEELYAHCVVGAKSQIRELKKELKSHAESVHSQEEATEFISKCHVDTQYDQVMGAIEKALEGYSRKISSEDRNKLMATIKSRQDLKSLLSKSV